MNAKTKPAPTEPSQQRHAAMVAQACRRIEAAEQPPSLDALAREAGLSPHHFHRVFKAITGLTPKAYADAHRARAVRARLASGRGSVTEAIFDAGFNANSRFYEQSEAVLGMRPRQYRAGGVDTRIMFALGQCALGAILVARSDKGVCAISLGDDPDALLRELQDRFPRAELVGGDAGFERLVAQVVGLVEAPNHGHALAAGRARHGVPAARVAGAAADPGRPDRELRRDRAGDRVATFGTGGGWRLCGEHACSGDSMPPRGTQRRCAVGVSMGCRAQTRTAFARGRASHLSHRCIDATMRVRQRAVKTRDRPQISSKPSS